MGSRLTAWFSSRIHRAPRFLRRKMATYRVSAATRDLPSQRAAIADLLEEDEFLLIILDACRYDAFERTYHSYFTGDSQRVSTMNTYTKQYQTNTWPDSYELTYVAGGPVISDRTFELSDLDYRPSDHFAEIVHAWDMGYEKELGVTPPEAVTEVALETNHPRMVVHYFQPHAPYIGDVRLRSGQVSGSENRSAIENRVESLKEIYDRIERGEIDEQMLREAYDSNLKRALAAVQPLVDATDYRTVITTDHGELLGEDERYLHGGPPHELLCVLPWLEVDGIVGEIGDVEVKRSDRAAPSKDVESQLEDLGYL